MDPYRRSQNLKDIAVSPQERLATPGSKLGAAVADIAEGQAVEDLRAAGAEQQSKRRGLRAAATEAMHTAGLTQERELSGSRLETREQMHEEEVGTRRTIRGMEADTRALELREAKARSERATLFSLVGQAVNLTGTVAKEKKMNEILDKYTARANVAGETAAYFEEISTDFRDGIGRAVEEFRRLWKSPPASSAVGTGSGG